MRENVGRKEGGRRARARHARACVRAGGAGHLSVGDRASSIYSAYEFDDRLECGGDSPHAWRARWSYLAPRKDIASTDIASTDKPTSGIERTDGRRVLIAQRVFASTRYAAPVRFSELAPAVERGVVLSASASACV